jgi:AcrR family transcriptional regulator
MSRLVRQDALRNRSRILEAGAEVFAHQPAAGLAEVARHSGLTRATVYAHFDSRSSLLEALARRAFEEADRALAEARPSEGAPDEALDRIVCGCWRIVERQRGVVALARAELAGPTLHELHGGLEEELGKLARRGRRHGPFRTDVPVRWLVASFQGLVHAAGEEVAAGRLRERDAERSLRSTVLAAWCAHPGAP